MSAHCEVGHFPRWCVLLFSFDGGAAMLVTCPACGARYEIEAGLIPPEGRRVQCSACEHVWQEFPSGAHTEPTQPTVSSTSPRAEREEDGERATSPPPDGGPTTASSMGVGEGVAASSGVTEDVRAILREEARREAQARREKGLVEVQPEFALSSSREPAPRRAASGPTTLPDPDRINETLRAASRRAADARGADGDSSARTGFVTGLLVGLCIVAMATAAYVAAPRLAVAVPNARPAIQSYVAAIDGLRGRLDNSVARVSSALSDLIGSGE
jgi:predicted Zn finger-like uncharacterized protein